MPPPKPIRGNMAVDTRALKKRLHDLNTGAVKPLKTNPENGKRLLSQAKKASEERKRDVDRAAFDQCYEMAIDIRNLSKGRILGYGGFGNGKFLGGGRFSYNTISRKWEKVK